MLIHSLLISVIEAKYESLKLNANYDTVQSILHRTFWKFIIVSFGKCFTDSKLSKLDPNECFISTLQLHPLQEEIIHIRHDFMAHRNDREFEQVIVYLVPNVTKNTTDYKIRSLTLSSANIDTLKNYAELFNQLKNIAFQKMQKTN